MDSAHLTERPPLPPSVKANPGTPFSFRLKLLFVLALFVLGIIDMVIPGRSTIMGLFVVGYGCLMIVLFILQEQQRGRLDRKRQLAAAGDQSLLAREQIIPDQGALSLPATIQMRPQWKFIALIIVVFTAFIVLMIVASFLVASGGTANFTSPKFLIVLAISAPVFILPTVVLFIVFFLRRNRRMEITESGLTLYDVTGTHRVLWNEARLFAIYIGRKGQPAIYYELSSAKDIVRWIWLRKYTKFNTEVPTTSLKEYNEQMQAMHSLIAGRTGLQLYDLREPVKKQA